MTMIRKESRAVTETVLCDERYVILRVANYLIVNVYMPCVGTVVRQMICDDILSIVGDYCERHSDCVPIIAGDCNINLDTRDAVASLFRQFASEYSLVRCDDLFPQQKKHPCTYIALSQPGIIRFR